MNSDYGDGANPVILKSEVILSLCEQLLGGSSLGAKQKSILYRCPASGYRCYQQGNYMGTPPTLQDFREELLKQDEPEAQEIALAIELFTDGSLNTFAKHTLSDVMDFLFKLETVEGIDFKIDVQKPPRSKQWECSISFDGKSMAEVNADMCLFLEQWEDERSELRAYGSTQAAYRRWKEQTLAYYAANAVKCSEPEELDRDERIAKRTAFLEKEYGKSESNE